MAARFVETAAGSSWLNLGCVDTIIADPNNANQSIATDDTGKQHSLPVTAYHPGRSESAAAAIRRFIEVENDPGPGTHFVAVRHIREIQEQSSRRLVAIDDQGNSHTLAIGETFTGSLSPLLGHRRAPIA